MQNNRASRIRVGVAVLAVLAISGGGMTVASAKDGSHHNRATTSISATSGVNSEVRALKDAQKAALEAKKDALQDLKKSGASKAAIEAAKAELKTLKDAQKDALKAKKGTGNSSDDDGTADQGKGDAPGTGNSSDDDGTADQGKGDAPGTGNSSDDDGTADQGKGDAPGTGNSSDDDGTADQGKGDN
jgi:hypothetical protein